MRNELTRTRWTFILIMFFFLFFQQWMGLLIDPITVRFSQMSSVIDRWMIAILPVNVIIAMISMPLWGILFDRHSRRRLLSMAGFLWGVSAWLMGIAPTFTMFNLARGLSGMAQASFSGIFALAGDLFKPTNRGKVFALLLLAQPLARLFFILIPNIIDSAFGWRPVLIVFGAIGFLLTIAILLSIIEPKRGAKEPALADIRMTGTYLLDTDIAFTVFITPSLILIYFLIFFGTIPAYILLEGVLAYLSNELALPMSAVYVNLLPTMLGLLLGYSVGGVLGDIIFRYKKTGRLILSLFGLVLPPLFLYRAFQTQDVLGQEFVFSLLIVSFFMAFVLPNLFASIMDVALPEIRATASALGLLFQTISVFVSPMIMSMVQGYLSLREAILWICILAWIMCILICAGLFVFIPKDIEHLRRHMAYRAHLEARLQKKPR